MKNKINRQNVFPNRTILLKGALFAGVFTLSTACNTYYKDEVLPPTDQELTEYRQMHPSSTLKEGVFHMQRVQEGSSVLIKDRIQLKRPELPPFDVAYISRDLESILLELSNAAGESIIIPQGLRGRKITLVHAGADFQEMLTLVLGKAGYHYNYVNGVWHITRYPIRNYVLEIGQGDRAGSLRSSDDLQREEADGATTAAGGTVLDTDYADQIWDQVEATLTEFTDVGITQAAAPGSTSSAAGITPSGNIIPEGSPEADDILPPPSLNEGAGEAFSGDDLFGVLTETGGLRPTTVGTPETTDHTAAEEDAEPWFNVTRSAGLITVRAAPEAHRLIEDYLEQVHQSLQRQIFIEARIVAVTHDRTTNRGLNLSKDTDFGDTVLGKVGFNTTTEIDIATVTGGFAQFSSTKNDLTAIIQNLSQIGDVYTISSPSLLARNNQISRVSLTRQLGYSETEIEQNTTNTGDVVIGSRTDTARFKNAGTVMSVMPFIGRNKVQMRIRLSVASKSGDTAIQTRVGDDEAITNLVPELATNIIDQDMVLDFGRVYAIGGLIESSTDYDHTYTPLVESIPLLSNIARQATSRKQDTEFIVLLRVSRS